MNRQKIQYTACTLLVYQMTEVCHGGTIVYHKFMIAMLCTLASTHKQDIPVYEVRATIIKKLGCFIPSHGGFFQYQELTW